MAQKRLPRPEPYWIFIPRLLAGKYGRKNGRPPGRRGFLGDVIRAQYDLYLAVKIHDDLFDRQITGPALVWTGDDCLLESQRILIRRFGSSPEFWDFCHSAIRKTIQAVRDIDSLQKKRNTHYRKMIRKYAALYAVCKIAAYAVCLKARRMRDFRIVSEFFDRMAMAGQAIDDFEDIIEDGERGRINTAAAFFLQYGTPPRPQSLDRIGRSLIFTDASDKYFRMLKRHLDRAETAIRSLNLPGLPAFMASYRYSVRCLEEHLHSERLKILFGRRIIRSSEGTGAG
ncbi:class 1 isoprenoid biosynthesis enzyme [bacterium]|nr:class 1 isoprenoid biosynthesis enzyme [bacterium]